MKNLILLHGALGASSQFIDLKQRLENHFKVFSLHFDGHGSGAETEEMSIELFSETLKAFIDEHQLVKPLIFGYSMGGYIALYSASKFPDSIGSILTLGTKFKWDEETSAKEIKLLDPEKIAEKIPKFASYLESVQAPKDWKKVMYQTQKLMLRLGKSPLMTSSVLEAITIPIHLRLGAEDTMVSKEETEVIQHQLSNATFEVVDAIPHPIQQIPVEKLEEIIRTTLI